MKKIGQIKLKTKEKRALQELRQKILENYSGAEIILYGSKARGDDDEFSDMDILILLEEKIETQVKNKIIDMTFDIELKNDVVFGLLIDSKRFWNSGLARAMPIHWNVDKEGIAL